MRRRPRCHALSKRQHERDRPHHPGEFLPRRDLHLLLRGRVHPLPPLLTRTRFPASSRRRDAPPAMTSTTARTTTITYDDRTVRQFMIASIAWGIVGML